MIKHKQTIVIIGRTSGFGEAVANNSLGDANIIHVAGLSTGLDVNDEKQTCAYFESMGAFDHRMITGGSYALVGKVIDVDIADAKAAFDTKFWGTINAAKPTARSLKPTRAITVTSGMLSRKVVVNTYLKRHQYSP
ncbi:Putative dehydrogenase (fragment) [Vibrio tapetis subsp. tapetis]|uniref:Dehydrogenase n=1 Tax=Vibrio tapetis subsp. tapetis TaxID=1671868 RepID=A0A2N8ZIA2_9VIBR